MGGVQDAAEFQSPRLCPRELGVRKVDPDSLAFIGEVGTEHSPSFECDSFTPEDIRHFYSTCFPDGDTEAERQSDHDHAARCKLEPSPSDHKVCAFSSPQQPR